MFQLSHLSHKTELLSQSLYLNSKKSEYSLSINSISVNLRRTPRPVRPTTPFAIFDRVAWVYHHTKLGHPAPGSLGEMLVAAGLRFPLRTKDGRTKLSGTGRTLGWNVQNTLIGLFCRSFLQLLCLGHMLHFANQVVPSSSHSPSPSGR